VVVAATVAALAVIVLVRPQGSANAGPLCLAGEAIVPVTADAKASAAHPGRHYGHARRWKVNYGRSKVRSVFTFDLPVLPLQCSVSQAVLKLKGTYAGTPKRPDTYPSANVNLSIAQSHWTEAGVTWRNMPKGYACDGGTQDYARTSSWVLTGIVQSAYRCLESGRLDSWNGLKVGSWSPRGRGASWKIAVDSRESRHPPVVEISWG
jgi:hypothetical protein